VKGLSVEEVNAAFRKSIKASDISYIKAGDFKSVAAEPGK
jgi:hypothetical protein